MSVYSDALFLQLSAVFSGVKDIRSAVDQAREAAVRGRRTVLFVDEVHRFNKSQQDAFLPHIEDGTICFIGATTENPSFEVNTALLSRLRVYRLKSVSGTVMTGLVRRTIERCYPEAEASETFCEGVATLADGDVRQALNLIELATDLADGGASQVCDEALLGIEIHRHATFRQGW